MSENSNITEGIINHLVIGWAHHVIFQNKAEKLIMIKKIKNIKI